MLKADGSRDQRPASCVFIKHKDEIKESHTFKEKCFFNTPPKKIKTFLNSAFFFSSRTSVGEASTHAAPLAFWGLGLIDRQY